MSYSSAASIRGPAWRRFVALGDSLTAGRGDVGPDGRYIGWARRLADMLSDQCPARCELTNLAVDGADVATVMERQLPQVVELQPDLISLTVGMNDVRLREFDSNAFTAGLGKLLAALAGTGAAVLTCTLPDVSAVVELPAEYVVIAQQRLRQASDIIRSQSVRYQALCLDTWAMPDAATDPALFTADRLHPNANGHRKLAAAFAELLFADGEAGLHLAPLPAAD
jgi:lysophospholipase L1-like esterase